MADKKISELDELTTPDQNLDFIPIVDASAGTAGETKKINMTNLGVGVAADFKSVSASDNGIAFVGGDQGGNTRGANALDIQSTRGGNAQIAKGTDSLIVGSSSLITGNRSSSFGRVNEIKGDNSHAIGELNILSETADECSVVGRDCFIQGNGTIAQGTNIQTSTNSTNDIGFGKNILLTGNADNSICIGTNINMSGSQSVALGYNLGVEGDNSAAIGRNVRVSQPNIIEIGGWGIGDDGKNQRISSVRCSSDFVAISINSGNIAPAAFNLDLNVLHGEETADLLPVDMFSIRRSGDEIMADINITGQAKTVSFGTATNVGGTSIGGAIQNVRSDAIPVNSIRQLTQAEYTALVDTSNTDANTVYIIVG